MGQQYSEFEGARARLQRLRDAKLFTGWVSQVSPTHVSLKLNPGSQGDAGEKFFVQLFGHEQSLMFPAVLASVNAETATLAYDGEVKRVASSEEMRVLLDEDLKCLVKLGWFEAWASVLDVSFSGLGLKTTMPVERGEMANITLPTVFGDIKGRGEVRYCRKMEEDGFHRVGIELEEFDRLNMAKWRRFHAKVCGIEIEAA